jgi:hypothetical protein
MPAATRRRPKTSAPELGESPEHEAGEGPDEEVREGAEDMPPMSKGRRGRRGRKAVKDGSCSACAAGKPCSGKKDGDTSAGPGELYNPGRKNPRMNNDALSPQEYLDACDLGIQNESKAYIRARLDTEDAIRRDFGSRSSSGQSQNNGSTVRKVATGAAIAGGVAALAYGGHRSGAFRAAGSALRKAASSPGMRKARVGLKMATRTGMRKARTGFGQARSAASSGMKQARSGFSTGMKRAQTSLSGSTANSQVRIRRARRAAGNTMARATGKSPKQLSLFNDSMYADGFTLDADVFDGLIRADVKCGNGAISQGETCRKGKGKGKLAPLSYGKGIVQGAKIGAPIGGVLGAAGGAYAGHMLGGRSGALVGGLAGAVGGTIRGAITGGVVGAGVTGARKLGRSVRGEGGGRRAKRDRT